MSPSILQKWRTSAWFPNAKRKRLQYRGTKNKPHKQAFMLWTTTAHPVRFGMSRIKSATPRQKPNTATAINVLKIAVGTRTQKGFRYVQRLIQNTTSPMTMPPGAANQECCPATLRVRYAPSKPHASPEIADTIAGFIIVVSVKGPSTRSRGRGYGCRI